MSRIIKIDQYTKDFPSKYGLDADGSCYEVQEDFPIEGLLSYNTINSPKYGKILEPLWSKFIAKAKDLIMSSKNGCYIKLSDRDGFVECRPISTTKSGEPQMLAFRKEVLVKIGKDAMNAYPMSFEEREQIIQERVGL